MLVIGLTGGIGCGKTLASDYFQSLGVPIIDADVISRELVQAGSPVLANIVARFGKDILQTDQTLDRKALRQHIFNHPDDKQALENILHPAIRAQSKKQIAAYQGAAYVIMVVPLLLETDQTDLVDRILVIDCPPELQIKRVKTRDNSSADDINRIINSQINRDSRRLQADDIVNNIATPDALYQQLNIMHEKYKNMSHCQ